MKKPNALDRLQRLRHQRERLATEALGHRRAELVAAEKREREAETARDDYERDRQVRETRLYADALRQPAPAEALVQLGEHVADLAAGSRRQEATVQERKVETGQADANVETARAGWRDRRRDADRLDRLLDRRRVVQRKAAETRSDLAAEDEASLTPPGERT